MTYRLAINQCPIHGYMSVSLDDDNGGHRLTPTKCCGRWHTVKAWPMTEADLKEVAEVFSDAAANLCPLERLRPRDDKANVRQFEKK